MRRAEKWELEHNRKDKHLYLASVFADKGVQREDITNLMKVFRKYDDIVLGSCVYCAYFCLRMV